MHRPVPTDRTTPRSLLALLLAVVLLLPSAAFGTAGPPADPSLETPAAEEPRSVLVRFREPQPPLPQTARMRADVHSRSGGRHPRALDVLPGLEVVEVPPDMSAAELIARYESDPSVLYAEPDALVELAAVPDDTLFGRQWPLHNTGQRGGTPGADIRAPEAWNITRGKDHVIVAVIDTGVDYTHEDLARNIWPGIGYDFYDRTPFPTDGQTGHGTHVAGTIAAAANDGFGVAGVAPDVQIMALKVFDDRGSSTDVSLVLEAIAYAEENGARIINASWATRTFSLSLFSAIADSPALFVAAAGNSGEDVSEVPFYPAAFAGVLDNVLSVAATTNRDHLALFSNYGDAIDIAAPGEGVMSTVPGRERVVHYEPFTDPDAWISEFEETTPWGLTAEHFTSSPTALADSPGTTYANDEHSAARMSTSVSLSGESSPEVSFELLLDTQSGPDSLRLEASTDGGAWETVGQWSGSTQGAFQNISRGLSAFADAPELWLRFRFSADETVTASGAYIDDLRITATPDPGPSNRHGDKSGTSMATPHASGVAALLKSRNHLLTAAELREIIRDTAQPVDSLTDFVSTGARLDAAAAVASIAEGPDPFILIEGATRFDTALQASRTAFPEGLDPDGERTVVIASGRNWPDALGGSALAGVLGGPLLLTDTNALPGGVAGEVERLGAERAIVLGGQSAVAGAVADELAALLGEESVERIAGTSRYETAEMIAARVITVQGEDFDGRAFVATGATFADAVAAAPLAAANGWPLYLARPVSGVAPATSSAMLEAGVTGVLLLGGERALSAQTESEVEAAFGEGAVERLAGQNRYETAVEVASYAVEQAGHTWDGVGLATGRAFPDALTGGVVQGRAGSVIVLTPPATLSGATSDALFANRAGIGTVTYFGGTGAVSHPVRMEVLRALGW